MDIVDDTYWLGYAKTLVDSAGTRLNEAAGKISTLTATFWGLYTTAFIIGTTIKKLDEPWYIIILLVLPIPLLIASYLLALWVQMPRFSSKAIDPRIPADVEAFYNSNMKVKKGRLYISMALLIITGISLTIALVCANFTHTKTEKSLSIEQITDSKNILIIGDLPNKTPVTITVQSIENNIIKTVFNQTSMVYKDTHFEYTLHLPQLPKKFSVTASWPDLSVKSNISISKIFQDVNSTTSSK
jgi:hypothetical protein